jgi:acetyltransferase-like isoleucine patch superfamily enzyme
MKKYFKAIIMILVKIISRLYPHSLYIKLNIIRDILYSEWISNNFKILGKGTIIVHGINLVGGRYISIGEKTFISKGVVLNAWDKYLSNTYTPKIIIGNNVSIGDDCHISAINSIIIGNNVLFGKKITITDNSYGKNNSESIRIPPKERNLYSPGPVLIEDNVWIGDKVTILPNVHVGKNAIIGANAVVTKDVPANSIVAGIPAKIIKMY